jgi:hypothetical protein
MHMSECNIIHAHLYTYMHACIHACKCKVCGLMFGFYLFSGGPRGASARNGAGGGGAVDVSLV